MAPATTRMSCLEYDEKWECVIKSKDSTAEAVRAMAPEVIKNYEDMCRLGAMLT